MHASYQDQRFPARHFRLQAGSSQFSGSVPSQDEDGESDISGSTYDNYGRNRGKPTLGELLKQVGDTRATGSSPEHRPTEMLPAFVDTKSVPFVLSFTNLTYSVKIRSGMSFRFGREDSGSPPLETSKTILDRISGEARDGEILAVLGPSGSGKSTLIDALANRIARDSLKGSVTLNGESVDGRLLKAISAYVMQDDLLFPMLTVEETLNFAAEFRLPRTLSRSKKRSRVETLIDQLGLRRAAKTIIGDEGHRGVSGGERRRVSIGIDIVHDPIVLFLDEPTSGLDSTSAFMVVKVLQRIARTGSIVMMSIHQPSSRVVNLLDRMIILSAGNTVYTGRPASLPQFFSEFGHPVPENENYTEFALDLIRELETAPVSVGGSTGINQLIDFHRRWRELTFIPVATPERMISLKEAISASISRGKLVSGTAPEGASGAIIPTAPSSSSKKMPTYANPPWTETAILTRRSITNSRRMPELFLMRLAAVTVTGFILATVFWHLDGSPRGVRERVGFFSYAMSTAFYTCSEALPGFLMERYVFMRETAHNAYRRSSYVLSNSLASLPALILFAASFAAITFFAVGLAGSGSGFFYYLLITFGSFWSGSGFVTFLAGVLPHEMLGYTVIISCIAYFVLFAGMFITRARIPGYWVWFHYLSLVKYPFEGVMENEFGSAGRCFVNGEQVFEVMPVTKRLGKEAREGLLKALGGLVGVNITSETCVTTGSDILKTQSITQLGKWSNLWVTLAWGTLFRILFYIALAYGSKNKRK